MRLTTLIIVIALMQASAKTLAQKVSLNKNNASFKSVLKDLRTQSGFDFVITETALKKADPVSITVRNAELKDVLDQIFNAQRLSYSISKNTILVKEKTPSFFEKIAAAIDAIDIHGRVTDTEGKPLPGASVAAKNGPVTTTDANGYFTIKNIQPGTLITVSFIGFEKKEIPASANIDPIKLNASSSKLDEIQVVAYGTTTQRLTTGSIAKITASQIESSPQSNPILALAGRVAGVNISENSGTAGASFSINIRGLGTIAAGTLPLYIVDGVPFNGNSIEQSSGGGYQSAPTVIGSAGFNPLNVLAPDMIESIEVLKDADATAIYGSRAANGVIVITTKKGKAGATKVDANVYTGVSSASRSLAMLDASQYISMRRKAFANDGTTPTTANAADLLLFTPGWDTNFAKHFLNTGHFTDGNVAISGGSAETQFMLSENYRYESPIFTGDFSDKVSHTKLSVQHTSKDKRFKLSASANYANEINLVPLYNLSDTYNIPPNLPLYNSAGALAWYTGYTNPLSTLINTSNQTNKDLLGNISLSYEITKGLTFKTDAGYHTTEVTNTQTTLIAAKNPALASSSTGSVVQNNTDTKLYTIEPQLNYTRRIAKGQLTALVGGTYQYNNSKQPLYYRGTFTSDALYNDIGSVTINTKSSNFFERKYESVFGRLNYIWDNKYIINGNYRHDGSSTFAEGNRFGNFGSIGGAWIVSEENFLKDNVKWISFLKLRSSYGSIGNDQIPVYGYLSSYNSSNAYAGSPSLIPSRLANTSNYSWETTKKFDISTDIGFFKDRILLTATRYRNMTSNLLLSIPVAGQSGFSRYSGNLPGTLVKNTGTELELNTTNIQSKSFTWKSSFNISFNKNKLVAYPGLASSSYAAGYNGRTGSDPGFVIGQPLNMLFGYQFTGFNSAGVATVKDQNGDGVIVPGLAANNQGDYVPLGSADPKYYGALSNSFTYKNFQLDVLLQFVKKKSYNIYHGTNIAPGVVNTIFGVGNQPADILNQPFTYSASSGTTVSRAFVNYYALSDATVTDASYIRLKNVSLTYHLPAQLINHIGVKSAGVFFRAENLFTVTNYLGFDPENYGSTMPLNRMMTIGLQTSF